MNSPMLHRGKLAKAPEVRSVRLLTREDMGRLAAPRPPQGRPKMMRETHHRLARQVAAGMRHEEICELTGYSATRLYQLKGDPAFQELVTMYRGKVDEAWCRAQDEFQAVEVSNMRRMSQMVSEHIDRAEEEGELIPLKTLVTAIADRADRFGYSKKVINRNENVDFAKMMEQIARASGRSNVIDAKPIDQGSTAGSASDEGGTDG